MLFVAYAPFPKLVHIVLIPVAFEFIYSKILFW
ncbi:hypothetical protein [Flavobacterium sp. CHNK8]